MSIRHIHDMHTSVRISTHITCEKKSKEEISELSEKMPLPLLYLKMKEKDLLLRSLGADHLFIKVFQADHSLLDHINNTETSLMNKDLQ